MKKMMGFWESFEKYGWRVVGRSPLPAMLRIALQAGLPRYWTWMGIGGALLIMVMSWSYSGQTVVGARDLREVIEKAAERGDYQTARALFDKTLDDRRQTPVLGAETGLEDVVYPERVVERRIKELEMKLEVYPGNRQIYLVLADLYGQLVGTRVDTGVDPYEEKMNEYREKARVLDPNGE